MKAKLAFLKDRKVSLALVTVLVLAIVVAGVEFFSSQNATVMHSALVEHGRAYGRVARLPAHFFK